MMLGPQRLAWRTMVDEASHSDIELSFASAELPKPGEALDDAAAPEPAAAVEKPAKRPEEVERVDKDVYLEEHVDKDIAEGKTVAAPDSKPAQDPAPTPAAQPAKSKGKGKGKGKKGNN
jgi:hypothetical protein